uniref:Ig-like domain-containing protein n=1 Tax=Astyanax mexicanus TaxID=7994 RepID=A0A3B1JDW1_ASTMX
MFEGEMVTVRCDVRGGGDTEWTYSWYKNNHAVHTSNTSQEYKIRSITESDSGKYTCRGERRGNSEGSEISDAVTLSVFAKAVLSVSPQNWITEGDTVTLRCDVRYSSTGWNFSWYVYRSQLLPDSSRESGGSYTISPAAVYHTGLYWCNAKRGEQPYTTWHSNLEHLLVTASSLSASLIVRPSRSQHFADDPLLLICEGQNDSTGWRVRWYSHSKRKVSEVSDCSSDWGSVTGSTCSISSLSTDDTAVYWYSIVILESPVHPVTEGAPLTLGCLQRSTRPSDPIADFYKTGLFLQTSATGWMTIPTVSKSDEGLYRCEFRGERPSQSSWISVRVFPGASASGAPCSVLHLLSFSMAVSPYLLVTIILGVKCYRARAKPGEVDAAHAVIEAKDSL